MMVTPSLKFILPGVSPLAKCTTSSVINYSLYSLLLKFHLGGSLAKVARIIHVLGSGYTGEPSPCEPELACGIFPDAAVQAAISAVNACLRSLATREVIIFDSAAVLAGADGYVRPAYVADELHLSAAGYAALNAALAPLLTQEEP